MKALLPPGVFDPHNATFREAGAAGRSRQLFALVTGVESRPRMTGAELADAIEDLLPANHRHAGTFIGTEAAIAWRFGVGRRVVRQASRLLSARGAARASRGLSGGLVMATPDRDRVLATLGRSMGGGVSPRAIHDADSVLAPVLATHDGGVARFVRDILDVLSGKRGPSQIFPDEQASAAHRLAEQIVEDRDLGREGAGTRRLGALADFAEDYETSLEVVVEAIRLLEDRELVYMQRGRAGGVMRCPAGASQAARLVHSYFATLGACVQDCDAILRAINVAIIDLASKRATPAAVDVIQARLAAMAVAGDPTAIGTGWFLLQRALSDAADSPVLHILARCLSGSVVLRRVSRADLDIGQGRALLAASHSIVGNVTSGRSGRNLEPHLRCQNELARCW